MTLFAGLAHLFFPRLCAGCGTDISRPEKVLCVQCWLRLPRTNFQTLPENPVANIFRGRAEVEQAAACFYFSKDSLLQKLIHQFKYKDRKDIAIYLGMKMGALLKETALFQRVEVVIPVPLFAAKEKHRGYNQSALLAAEIAGQLAVPLLENVLVREKPGDTQTRKSRMARWQNVAGAFTLKKPEAIAGKNVLLIDDVLTTGATLEACTRTLSAAPATKVYIATLAFASD